MPSLRVSISLVVEFDAQLRELLQLLGALEIARNFSTISRPWRMEIRIGDGCGDCASLLICQRTPSLNSRLLLVARRPADLEPLVELVVVGEEFRGRWPAEGRRRRAAGFQSPIRSAVGPLHDHLGRPLPGRGANRVSTTTHVWPYRKRALQRRRKPPR